MTHPDDDRTVPARDVPPTRPVDPSTPDGGGGLGPAARAVADAVSRLLGGSGPEGSSPGKGAAAGVLRDVISAVASAAGRRSPGGGPAAAPPTGDRTPAGVIGDVLTAAVERLPIRDAARLRAAHPEATDEQIADALVTRAGRLTGAIGAATGGLSAAQWLAAPTLIALPLELGAETLLTAAVEVVLVGELHELYGRPAAGGAHDRAAAYLASWSTQRALDPRTPAEHGEQGLVAVVSGAGMRALRRRLNRRLARALPSAAPFLLGAALGGRGNKRGTEQLAHRLRRELRSGPGGRG